MTVVVEESPEEGHAANGTKAPNGNRLAAMIAEDLGQAVEKFGSPASWQREQRRERHQPGRESV